MGLRRLSVGPSAHPVVKPNQSRSLNELEKARGVSSARISSRNSVAQALKQLILSIVTFALLSVAALLGAKARDAVAAKHRTYVETRIAQLQELGYGNDSEALRNILAELNNSDREIRKAAVDATIQFGSREAIPVLSAAAAKAKDRQEKLALQEAIEFLALP